MRLLIALFKYFPWGGLQKDTLRVMEGALAQGHQVTLLTTAWDGPALEHPNLTIEYVRPRGLTNTSRMKAFDGDFQRCLQRREHDVSIAMNRVSNADFYFVADTCMKTYLAGRKNPLVRTLLPRYRAILAQENAIASLYSHTTLMVIAQAQKEDFKRGYDLPDNRFVLLPPGMNPACVRPKNAEEIRAAKRQELGLADDALALILVGTNFIRKGVDRVMNAVASLPDALKQCTVFYLVGNDSSDKVRALAAAKGIGDRFIHLGPRNDVHELLLACDLMVHPAREEGTGTVLVEGLAAGLPVLCSECCGFSPYVQDATGTVTPEPFNQMDLNQMLAESLGNLHTLKQKTIAYAATQDFCGRTDAILNLCETFTRLRGHLKQEDIPALLNQHREILSRGWNDDNPACLKDTPKRKVTRCLLNGNPVIVKEYCRDSRLRLRSHCTRAVRDTALLCGLTPAVVDTFKDGPSRFIVFVDAGKGTCHSQAYEHDDDVCDLYCDSGRILGELHNRGVYHNDTKASNFVRNEHCPEIPLHTVIIDCDRVKCYPRLPREYRVKNLAQFIGCTGWYAEDTWLKTVQAFVAGYTQKTGLSQEEMKPLLSEAISRIEQGKIENYWELFKKTSSTLRKALNLGKSN